MEKSNVKSTDSFGTFLETTRRLNESVAPRGNAPTKLLGLLASGPKRIQELMGLSNLSLTELADALKTMVEAGLIIATGFTADDQVSLTPAGDKMATLAASR